MQENSVSQTPQPIFFLFVNSGSGGNLGSKIISQQIEKIQFLLPVADGHNQKCHIYFYNMRKNKDEGFFQLKKYVEKGRKCYAIVCGGDGTIMWVVNQLIMNQIRVLSVPIGIIPLGTGNDFSRELGWGGQKSSLLENNYKSLKKLIQNWLSAKEEYFDIWDIEAQIYEHGKFQKVQDSRNSLIEGKKIEKTFCNYFSFGIDGKIGYSFDMHRTSTRLGNLAMYGILGAVKAATKTKTIDQLVESIEIYRRKSVKKNRSSLEEIDSSNFSLSTKKQLSNTEKIEEQEGQNSVLDLLIKSQKKLQKNEVIMCEEKNFQQGFSNILALNINSYTGGVKDIWQNAKNNFLKNHKITEYTDPSTGDGKLQIVAFGSSVGLAMQRTFGGFASKVAQSQGPFIFNYKKYEGQLKHRTYLQIDGEFIRFTAPKRVKIKKSAIVPQGRIKVLRNVENSDNPFNMKKNEG